MSQNTLKSEYPHFKENQLLRAKDLNSLFEYLDGQIRHTRGQLIGTGIVCGLEVLVAKNGVRDSISISAGFGLTSDGYIIKLDEIKNYTHYRNNSEGEWELFESNESGSTAIKGGTSSVCNRIVRLRLIHDESTNGEDSFGCINSKDIQSKSNTFAVKAYLAPVPPTETTGNTAEPLWQLLTPISIPRYSFDEEQNIFTLNRVTTFSAYWNRYVDVCTALIRSIAEKIADEALDQKFQAIINNAEQNSFSDWETAMTYALQSRNAPDIQYCYDYLKDIVHTYNELADKACELSVSADCNSYKYDAHCMYLNLGWACPENYEGNNPHVHHFQPAPVLESESTVLQEVKFLYDKLVFLTTVTSENVLSHFKVPLPTTIPANNDKALQNKIRFTPSKGQPHPLGDRSIPYYYPDARMRSLWSYKAYAKDKKRGDTYFSDRISMYSEERLRYSIDDQSFFRIEGHVGHDYGDVLQTIQQKRIDHNLPFDIVGLKIGTAPDDGITLEDCHFEDLETVFNNLLKELLCLIEKLRSCLNRKNLAQQLDILDEFHKSFSQQSLTSIKEEAFTVEYTSFEELLHRLQNSELDSSCLARIDEILSRCFLKLFIALQKEYYSRINELKKELLFHMFSMKHPGLEHLAGVPRGGTFIIVYVNTVRSVNDEFSSVPVSKPDFLRQFELNPIEYANFPQNSVVVGDFALPSSYGCCNTCSPTAVVSIQPFILLDKKEFCDNDEREEIVVYPSGGQIESQDEEIGSGIVYENGCWFFDPSLTEPGMYSIIYKFNNLESKPLQLTVRSRPEIELELRAKMKQCTTDAENMPLLFIGMNILYNLITEHTNSDIEYLVWVDDDRNAATEIENDSFSVELSNEKNNYTIHIVSKGGICGDIKQDFSIQLFESITLGFPENICKKVDSDEEGSIDHKEVINVSEIGGIFTLSYEGEELDLLEEKILIVTINSTPEDDNCPEPESVTYELDITKLNPGSYTLSYEIAGEVREQAFDVIPPLSFEIEKVGAVKRGSDDQLEFEITISEVQVKYAEKYNWAIIDGSASNLLGSLPLNVEGDGVILTLPWSEDLAESEVSLELSIDSCEETASKDFKYPTQAGDDNGDVPVTPVVRSMRSTPVPISTLNRRQANRKQLMQELEKGGFKNKTISETKAMLDNPQLDASTCESQVNKLLGIFGQTSDENRRNKYKQLIGLLLGAFLDRQIANAPDHIPQQVATGLENIVEKLKDTDLESEEFLNDWQGEELEAPVIEEYKDLLR